ncbi:PREDICTED: basic proline-rich protein-like [Haliaeetus leucocephalus]|uniref:basic proline-rich protein-like n=1 Tax=Haliaeetus leucocephalus TaxID=52644 RepID=UPI00053CE8C8|nr:PREDICTED: basic proline-rich protein-like [Haliaeetus leucocephalus]
MAKALPSRGGFAGVPAAQTCHGSARPGQALKKSFEVEDGDEAPGSPPVSLLPLGTGDGHRPLQPSHPPCSGTATSPSPAPSPVLRSRLGTSLSAGRANGTAGAGIARVASFQTHQGFAAGPGSDGESLRSSSSSLESPAPTGPPQPPGTPPATSPGLKKIPSHSSVFPAEVEHPLHGAAASHGSLPALDLHIAEEPGMGTPPPDPSPWGTRSPATQPRARQPSSSSSSPAPYDGTEAALGLPTLPEGPEGRLPGGWDAAPRALPRPQLRVSLGASPGLAHRPPPLPRGQGEAAPAPAAPSPGRAEGLPPPAPQAAPFKLVSQPQTVQVSSQPAFLGGLVLVPALGTLAPTGGVGANNPSAGLVGPWGPCTVAAVPGEAADGGWAAVTPEHGRTRSCPFSSLPTGTPLLGAVLPNLPGEPRLPSAAPALPMPGRALMQGDGDAGDRTSCAGSLLPTGAGGHGARFMPPGTARCVACSGGGAVQREAERGAGSTPGPPGPGVPGELPMPPRH